MPLENGHLLNHRYRILDILGQGGMGAVYRAVDENLDVTVAIKENSFQSDDYARQFQREAKILAALRHPNLPRVFDYFVIDQQGQYLVMDYIEGEDLRQWMTREHFLSEIETIQIGIAICDALIYLHGLTPMVTHRDIKPGNIKITPSGEVVLVDFGLVKQVSEKEATTTAARAMTPGYSPPEQYGDTPTDHRSDLFSLGATLYAALAGYLPEDSLERATGKTSLTPLRQYNPSVSGKTAQVIEKALELKFEDRWQTARDFKFALLQARELIPREKWVSKYLAPVRWGSRDPVVEKMPRTVAGEMVQRVVKWFSPGEQKPDPMWLVFGVMLILLAVFLGITLLWPQAIQNILPGSNTTEATQQPSLTAAFTATQERQNPATETPEPILTDVSPTLAEDVPVIVTPSPTLQGGSAGMIAYVSQQTGSPQIWLLDLQTGEADQLTDFREGACQPDWSPDGEKLVFISPCPGKRSRYPGSRLYLMDVEEGFLRPLPASLEGDFDPAWSPDGQWIAFTTLADGLTQLMKLNLETLTSVRLSDGRYNDFSPAWSPDGERLAFVRNRGVTQIWLMDADGDNLVQFTRSGLIDNSNPAWSPDESLILFSQVLGQGSPSKQVLGMRLEDIGDQKEYRIMPSPNSQYIPLMDNVDFSPDGIWLAFDYWYHDVLSDIYIMIFPAGDLVQLTDHPASDYDSVWRPQP